MASLPNRYRQDFKLGKISQIAEIEKLKVFTEKYVHKLELALDRNRP